MGVDVAAQRGEFGMRAFDFGNGLHGGIQRIQTEKLNKAVDKPRAEIFQV